MKTTGSLLLVFLCGVVAFGQERMLEKSEFESVIKGANAHHEKRKGNSYRMKVISSSKAIGRPQTDWSSEMVIEYGPAETRRTVSTSVFGDEAVRTIESLRIGKWEYSRSGDEPWKRKEHVVPPTERKQEDESSARTINAEYKYLGISDLGGKRAHVYVRNERRLKEDRTTGNSFESDVKVTYWIGEDGALLKSEFNSESRGTIVSHTMITTTWEQDPSIKFAEPEVAT